MGIELELYVLIGILVLASVATPRRKYYELRGWSWPD